MTRSSTMPGRGWLTGMALLALLAPASQGQTELTFLLVPEESYDQGDYSRVLPSGKVFIYRAGSYVPELVAEANKPQVVTPGQWLWIAEAWDEAGDYVSVWSGIMDYPEGAERWDRDLVGPVVPACKIDLGTAQDWQGVTRLDAVSLSREAVYPVIVKDRRHFLVPEGRFVAYAMDTQGVTAISRVVTCAAGETVELSRPEPPTAEHQDLMVSVQMFDGMTDERDELSAVLRPFDPSSPMVPQEPTAAFRTHQRATFFFLDASARELLVLGIDHPQARAHRQELSPQRGGVRELPDVVLEPRASPR